MTPTELHALVSQWPEEARPKGCDYCRICSWWNYITDDHAVMLHEASGAAYAECGVKEWPESQFESFRFDTVQAGTLFGSRIEAIHAAVMARAKR